MILVGWWIACLGAVIFVPNGFQEMPQSFVLSPYNLLFAFGMASAWGWRKIPPNWAPMLMVIAIALLSVVITYNASIAQAWLTMLYGVAYSTLIISLVILEDRGALVVPKWLSFLGDASYSTYLIHSLSVVFAAIIFIKLGVSMPNLCMLLTLTSIGVASGVALHLLAERPILKLMRRKILVLNVI